MSGSQRDRLLGRHDIELAFDALANRLEALGVRTHIYAVGGAAMSMAYRRSQLTMSVDVLTIDHREIVLKAAAEVARDLNLDPDWLNEDV